VEDRPLHHRVLAAVALLALLLAFGITAWWVVTDAIDFGERAEPPSNGAASELP
jgi:hypothetical protein